MLILGIIAIIICWGYIIKWLIIIFTSKSNDESESEDSKEWGINEEFNAEPENKKIIEEYRKILEKKYKG